MDKQEGSEIETELKICSKSCFKEALLKIPSYFVCKRIKNRQIKMWAAKYVIFNVIVQEASPESGDLKREAGKTAGHQAPAGIRPLLPVSRIYSACPSIRQGVCGPG